jgi:hypothetical protein
MLFTSILLGEMRGSLNGVTASRNRSGQYFRVRAVPVNPNSPRQMAARLSFAARADEWSDILTQVQRDAWNLYADNVTVKNKLGEDILLSGSNMYLRTNTSRVATGLPVVSDAPTLFTLGSPDTLFDGSISEATQLISVAFNVLSAWVGEDDAGMLVYMSIPQSPGREFLSPQNRVAGAILGDSGTPPTSPETIAVPFAVAEGQKVIVSHRVLRADGRVSEVFRDTVVVAA